MVLYPCAQTSARHAELVPNGVVERRDIGDRCVPVSIPHHHHSLTRSDLADVRVCIKRNPEKNANISSCFLSGVHPRSKVPVAHGSPPPQVSMCFYSL